MAGRVTAPGPGEVDEIALSDQKAEPLHEAMQSDSPELFDIAATRYPEAVLLNTTPSAIRRRLFPRRP
jgi:hypothetical protein